MSISFSSKLHTPPMSTSASASVLALLPLDSTDSRHCPLRALILSVRVSIASAAASGTEFAASLEFGAGSAADVCATFPFEGWLCKSKVSGS